MDEINDARVVHLNQRELHILLVDRPGWAIEIKIRGWFRPRLDVQYQPVPIRPDPGRPERKPEIPRGESETMRG